MEPTELFRKTLSFFLEERGRGSQKDLADRTGVPSSLINDFIKGRKAISELKKNDISRSFDFEYEEFIALGRRLWQSDDPFLWALRAIYLDEQRFRDLVNESDISETRFKGIFNIGKSLPLSPEEKEKILEATGFTESEFLDFGRREILKNPKMKWDLGGMVQRVGTSTTIPYRQETSGHSGLSESSDGQPSEDDQITLEHIELVRKFINRERLKKINEDLLVIEQNPDALRDVEAYIRGLAAGIRYSSGGSCPSRCSGGNLKNGTGH